jgi:anion-transporting  ArsA/GET3 family ATPase
MVRILVHTGKGGVGKTTVAAATALRCAARGQRTIILSTDAAHSLGDALDIRLEAEPIPVAPNLWAQESTRSMRWSATGARAAVPHGFTCLARIRGADE